MQVEEIRFMQMSRQHLLQPVEPTQVVRDLCGLQAQFLSHALHSLKIRSLPFEQLPDSLAKSWTIRGTMHLFAKADLPLMLYEGRERFLRPCDTLKADEAVSAERKQFFAQLILNSIGQGESEREQLKALCISNGMTEDEEKSLFNPWGGLIRALCEAGWIYHKPQEKKAYLLCEPFVPFAKAEAEAMLANRYFTHYGPATIRDAAYFFGVSQTKIKSWMKELPLHSATLDGRNYYWCGEAPMISDDIPDCIFLSGFDPLMLGYQKTESLYLYDKALRGIFSLNGMVAPAVLLHGKVAARWQKKGRKLLVTPFTALGARERTLIAEKAAKQWNDFSQLVITEE